MSFIQTIRKLNQISRNRFSTPQVNFDPLPYLIDCFTCLRWFFYEQLSDRYLFSALTLKQRDDEKGITVVKIEGNEESDIGYHFAGQVSAAFKPIIKHLLQVIDDGRSVSLTRTLLNDTDGRVLFLYSNEPYKKPIMGSTDSPISSSIGSRIDVCQLSALTLTPVSDPLCPTSDELKVFFTTVENERIVEELRGILKKASGGMNIEMEQVGFLLWYYKLLQETYMTPNMSEKANAGNNDFLVHFIRPSFIEFHHNVLLSLATNRQLEDHELSFIALVLYRIVGQIAIEKTKEVEKLKRKKSFSLTSHSFKTELSTTIIPQVKWVAQSVKQTALPTDSTLPESLDELLDQAEGLFRLTGLISLIDKIDKKEDFLESGRKDDLISQTPETVNIFDYCDIYNRRHPHLSDVVIQGNFESNISIKVFDKFLSALLIKLFYKTLFENLIHHGRRTKNNQVVLFVSQTHNGWVFENDTKSRSFEFDKTKLTGNLSLFKTLIEETKSGKLMLNSDNHKFTIMYEQSDYT